MTNLLAVLLLLAATCTQPGPTDSDDTPDTGKCTEQEVLL